MCQHKRARSCAGRNAPSSAVRPPALHGATGACRRAGGAVWPPRPAPACCKGSWHLIDGSTTAIAACTLQSARTESPECALTCGSSTAARVRAPRGTHGTPRRGVRHGREAGPIGRHRPLSGPRGAPWRAPCPPTAKFDAGCPILSALWPARATNRHQLLAKRAVAGSTWSERASTNAPGRVRAEMRRGAPFARQPCMARQVLAGALAAQFGRRGPLPRAARAAGTS